MLEVPKTRPSLLLRMRDTNDEEAWHAFVELYAPLVFGYARKRGLQDADAADLTQDVMRSVASAMQQATYDPSRGSFRGWLHRVTQNAVYKFLLSGMRERTARPRSPAAVSLDQLPGPTDSEDWENEYRKRVFAWACRRVKPEFSAMHWRAFWETSVEGVSVKATAKQLGMKPGAIYVAKSRILARLKKCIELAEHEEDSHVRWLCE